MINPYQQYKQSSINTMTKGELLLLLFDEIIKKLNQGKILMENKDYQNAQKNLNKAREIITHLIFSLDEQYGISQELTEMYAFFNAEIIKATTNKSTKFIEDILPMIKDLRNTWAEADKIARATKKVV